MEIIEEPISGLLLLKPKVLKDARGYFFESYNQSVFKKIGIDTHFIQDNQSLSVEQDVLRGLHFQNPPYCQAKLVRVTLGSVNDVVVDIRSGSPTYGKHYCAYLSAENQHLLYIPEGFAHGFVTLEPNTIFNYKCSAVYNKASEDGILWNDPDLNIDWKTSKPILSNKDKKNPFFKDFNNNFVYK